VQLQVAVPEQRLELELQLELVLAPQLVRVLVLAQEQVPKLVPELVRTLLVAQLIHCDRCSQVHLLE
jgi:Ser/Thr protein kinase RdoA (MazF antagonist)